MSVHRETFTRFVQTSGWAHGAELGVDKGILFRMLLDVCPLLTLIGVDTFPDLHRSRRVFEAARVYPDRTHVLHMTTREASATVDDRSLDFVFIDADHGEDAVLDDIACWQSKVRTGGWLGGHDFCPKFPGVVRAVRRTFGAEVHEPGHHLGDVDMLTVVLWRWRTHHKGGNKFTRGHVERMQSMLARHLHQPHRIVCITDQPKDLPDGVTPAPMPPLLPWDYKGLRRMWLYSKNAGVLGDRLLQLDLDVVITDTIDPLVNRPEDFVIWKSDSNWKDKWAYNATVMLITPGAKEDIWQRYAMDPKGILRKADKDGWGGKVNSDQALACYLMRDQQVAVWTQADGIFAYRVFAGKHGERGAVLPEGARLVSFHGPRDPSMPELQKRSPWIEQHWC